MTWLWWAPLGAAILHIVEEFVYPGGFAAWDRSYRPAIRESITPRLHVIMNGLLLLLCLQIALLAGARDADGLRFGRAGWLGLSALLFSNALFHIAGSVRTRTYSPGMITGIALYIPMAVFGYWHFLRSGEVTLVTATIAAVIGGSYHFWAALMHKARTPRARA